MMKIIIFSLLTLSLSAFGQSSYSAANQDSRSDDPNFDEVKDLSSGYVKEDAEEVSRQQETERPEAFDVFDQTEEEPSSYTPMPDSQE